MSVRLTWKFLFQKDLSSQTNLNTCLKIILIIVYLLLYICLLERPRLHILRDRYTITTGKLYFAECLRLCRVLFIGALGKAIFCRVPGTRQSPALGKAGLCRVPRHSAKVPLGKRWPARDGGHLPSDFVECLTDGTRQFFLFLKTYFAECQPQALGNFFYFLKTYFAECQPMALGKFFYFLKLILPRARPRHSAIFFIIF